MADFPLAVEAAEQLSLPFEVNPVPAIPVVARPVAVPARCPVIGKPVCYHADCHHYRHGGCSHPAATRKPRRRRKRA